MGQWLLCVADLPHSGHGEPPQSCPHRPTASPIDPALSLHPGVIGAKYGSRASHGEIVSMVHMAAIATHSQRTMDIEWLRLQLIRKDRGWVPPGFAVATRAQVSPAITRTRDLS